MTVSPGWPAASEYVVDTLPLHEAVRDRLDEHPFLDTFIGRPVPVLDGDNLARPYAAVWPSPGVHRAPALAGPADVVPVRLQVTAGGGDMPRCLRAANRVRLQLLGWAPAMPGHSLGALAEDPDYVPPPPIDSDQVGDPARYTVPLFFVTTITRR